METYQAQLKEAVEELASLQLELKTADRLLRRLAQSSDPSDEQKQELNETRSRASTLEQQLAEKHDEVQELRAEIGGLVALLEPRQGSEAGQMVTDHKSHRVRAIPSDIPLLDSSKPNFDLEQYLNNFERYMRGYGYPPSSWAGVLSLRIADDQLGIDFMNANVMDWQAAKDYWQRTIPQSDRRQIYFDELMDLRQGSLNIAVYNTKFNSLATRARFHNDSNLARLYLRSVHIKVQKHHRDMRLMEEVDARRRAVTLPDLELLAVQASLSSHFGQFAAARGRTIIDIQNQTSKTSIKQRKIICCLS